MFEQRTPKRFHLRVRLFFLCALLFMWGSAAGQETTEYVGPHERAKDLTSVYGRYEIYEAVKYGSSVDTTAAEAQAWVGQEMVVTAALYRAFDERIENPTYTVWFYPYPPEGVVVDKSERWSSNYLSSGERAGGDEIIKVYDSVGLWTYVEIIGTNELWVEFDGWYYKARKTTRPPLSPGHDDYCQVMGPCSAGQGDCDSDAECQSELTCVDGRGASYGFAADVGMCVADDHGNIPGSAASDGQ